MTFMMKIFRVSPLAMGFREDCPSTSASETVRLVTLVRFQTVDGIGIRGIL